MRKQRILLSVFLLLLLFGSLVYLFSYNSEYTNPKTKLFKTETETEFFNRSREFSNIPVLWWFENKNKNLKFNKSCAELPNIYHLDYNNLYWQTLLTTNGTFYLYGAYLDNRRNNKFGASVRILGMFNKVKPDINTYCQIWFNNETKPLIVETVEYKYVWERRWGNQVDGMYQPYLISCVIPKEYTKIPQSVSLVENECDNAKNLLKVIYNKPEVKKDFAICVKGLDFLQKDLSIAISEWIELAKILGADKIFMYLLEVHPNITKILKYYEAEGTVEVIPITLPGSHPNLPMLRHLFLSNDIGSKRLDELISYNDCFYKHMYEYNYLGVWDIDEMIIPVKDMNWKQLLKRIEKSGKNKDDISSYNARNVYFFSKNYENFKDVSSEMFMLQHLTRSEIFSPPGHNVKSFLNTEKVLTVHNHNPFACLEDCKLYSFKTEDAQLSHYRRKCSEPKRCEEYKKSLVKDSLILKYKHILINRVTKVLNKVFQ